MTLAPENVLLSPALESALAKRGFTSLTPVEGITSADVRIGGADIEHDGRATVSALRDAVAVAGYEVILVEEERRRLPVV